MNEQKTITAELIAIGEEVLGGHTISSNTAEIALMLEEIGILPHHHTTVGDRPDDIDQALQTALARSQIIIITGGLGPTTDDLTRSAVAASLGMTLLRDDAIVQIIKERFGARETSMPQSNLTQADIPRGGSPLPNPIGTAPGLYIPFQQSHIFLLPGVPAEMRVIMQDSVLPKLKKLFPEQKPVNLRKLRIVGLSESRLADLLEEAGWSNTIKVAYLPQENEIFLIFKGELAETDSAAEIAYQRLGAHIYAEGETSMPELAGQLLREKKLTLATAESCTGGLIGKMLTDISGSSDYYLGGGVVYSNHAKTILAGVNADLINEFGAVSPQVAESLALGIKVKLGADLALGVTGVAGPGGGTMQKPVGLVYAALATPETIIIKQWRFGGSRRHIRSRTANWALDLVRRWILDRWEQL